MSVTSRSLVGWVASGLLPRSWALEQARHFGRDYLEQLLRINSARVINDMKDRILESRRQLESEVRARLTEAWRSAERALANARKAQAAGTSAVTSELGRLSALHAQVDALRDVITYDTQPGPNRVESTNHTQGEAS
jgi:hypothetical protein